MMIANGDGGDGDDGGGCDDDHVDDDDKYDYEHEDEYGVCQFNYCTCPGNGADIDTSGVGHFIMDQNFFRA